MTLKQANQVNSYYIDRESKISTLKDSIRKQKTRAELDAEYFSYIQSELLKNGSQGSESLREYYERREDMLERRVHRQAKTNMYIFIAMTLLFIIK